MDNLSDGKPLDFEEAFLQLKKIVASLDSGDAGLEASLDNFEKGVGLLKLCREKLDVVSRRIELLKGVNEDNTLTTVVRIDENGAPLSKESCNDFESLGICNEETVTNDSCRFSSNVETSSGLELLEGQAQDESDDSIQKSEDLFGVTAEKGSLSRRSSGDMSSGAKRVLLDSVEAKCDSKKNHLQRRTSYPKRNSISDGLPFENNEPPF